MFSYNFIFNDCFIGQKADLNSSFSLVSYFLSPSLDKASSSYLKVSTSLNSLCPALIRSISFCFFYFHVNFQSLPSFASLCLSLSLPSLCSLFIFLVIYFMTLLNIIIMDNESPCLMPFCVLNSPISAFWMLIVSLVVSWNFFQLLENP